MQRTPEMYADRRRTSEKAAVAARALLDLSHCSFSFAIAGYYKPAEVISAFQWSQMSPANN
jgi:hypothetical protein